MTLLFKGPMLLYSNVYQIRGCRWTAGTGQFCHRSRWSAVMMRSARTGSEKRKSGLGSCDCRTIKPDLTRRWLKQGWVRKWAGSTRGWRKGATIDVQTWILLFPFCSSENKSRILNVQANMNIVIKIRLVRTEKNNTIKKQKFAYRYAFYSE